MAVSMRIADQAAKNNLAGRKVGLNAEREAELTRLKDELRRKLERLAEEAEDERDQGEGTPAKG
jgi:hypothetical protein